MEKICTLCHMVKPLNEFALRDKAQQTYRSVCIPCRALQRANNYQARRSTFLEKQRQYRLKNPDITRQANKMWRENNAENIALKRAIYYEIHREELCTYQKQYRIDHPETAQRSHERHREKHRKLRRILYQKRRNEENLYNAEWRKSHPEERRIQQARYRAQKRNASCDDMSQKQWEELMQVFQFRCAYCGRQYTRESLTMDHITPLSRGGQNTISNIVPACKPCNSSKHTGEPLTSVQPLLLTVAPQRKKYKKRSGSSG